MLFRAASRIQVTFFSIPYFWSQGQYLNEMSNDFCKRRTTFAARAQWALVHLGLGEIGIKLGTKLLFMLFIKSSEIVCKKEISMLIGLKVSSLACKRVFYRPKHNAKGGPHGIEFWRSWIAEIKITNRYRPELRSLKCHKWLNKILDLSDPLKCSAKTDWFFCCH